MKQEVKATHVFVPVELFDKLVSYLEEKPFKEAAFFISGFAQCKGGNINEDPKIGKQEPKLEEVKNG